MPKGKKGVDQRVKGNAKVALRCRRNAFFLGVLYLDAFACIFTGNHGVGRKQWSDGGAHCWEHGGIRWV